MRAPTNAQYLAPRTMLTRTVPCDFVGTVSPTAFTTDTAEMRRPRRIVTCFFVGTVVVDAVVVDVVVVDAALDVVVVGTEVLVVDAVDVVMPIVEVVVEGIVDVVLVVDVLVDVVLVDEVLVDEVLVDVVLVDVDVEVVVVEAMVSDPTSAGMVRSSVSPVPSWPSALEPQQRTPPSPSTAHACWAPDTTSTSSPARPVTTCWSEYPEPMHVTAWSVPNAQVCASPVETVATPDAVVSAGVAVHVAGAVSTPSCPAALFPKHVKPPSASTTHVCSLPADTRAADEASAEVAVGVVAFDVAVVPRRPFPQLPQHHTVWFDITAQAWVAPTSRWTGSGDTGKPACTGEALLLVAGPAPSWL